MFYEFQFLYHQSLKLLDSLLSTSASKLIKSTFLQKIMYQYLTAKPFCGGCFSRQIHFFYWLLSYPKMMETITKILNLQYERSHHSAIESMICFLSNLPPGWVTCCLLILQLLFQCYTCAEAMQRRAKELHRSNTRVIISQYS